DEERHGDQRIPVEHLESRVEGKLEGAGTPQPQRRSGPDGTDDAIDPLARGHQDQHRGKHEKGDEFGTHLIGFPRASATSLKNWEMVCSSIRKMPSVMKTFTGHSTGAQAV